MGTPLLEDVVDAGVEFALEDLQTSQVGIVKSFNALNHTVDVQPMVKRVFLDEEGEKVEQNLPVITSVPVWYQGSGPHRTTFPIEKGSLVLLVHLSHARDAFQFSKGTETVPAGDNRRHTLTDCIAIPGLLTTSGTASTTALVKSGATVIYAPRLYLGGGLLTSPVVRKLDLQVLKGLLDAAALANTGPAAVAISAVATAVQGMITAMLTTVEAT